MKNIINALEWRYAVKQFDPSKKISQNQLEELKRATQLSASSFGLQPYKVLIISDQDLMDKLKPASYNQSQVNESSHLFLFCAMKDFDKNDVNDYVENTMQTTGATKEGIKPYHDMMNMKIDSMNSDENYMWAAKQAYIALGNLLTAAAVMDIDTCPIEGFVPAQYTEILELEKIGLIPLVLASVGYRADTDKYQSIPKVRKSEENLFIEI